MFSSSGSRGLPFFEALLSFSLSTIIHCNLRATAAKMTFFHEAAHCRLLAMTFCQQTATIIHNISAPYHNIQDKKPSDSFFCSNFATSTPRCATWRTQTQTLHTHYYILYYCNTSGIKRQTQQPDMQDAPVASRECLQNKRIMALIFDIKRFAINDGPGIRTTIFLKGCPLKCVWCHNPEGISPKAVKLYTKKKCIGCQSCVEVCPENNLTLTPDGIKDLGHCISCGKCTDECPTLALEMAGKAWETEKLMEIVEKERQVMEESGGGVTLCGGEPMYDAAYLCQLLDELGRRNIHRTVDTTLFASAADVDKVAKRCELFLVDLKVMDAGKHKLYTGVDNSRILDNIRMVSRLGHKFWIRIPLIVGVNADDDNLRKSADFLASLPTKPEIVNLLVYHDIGKGKHARLGTAYNPKGVTMEAPTEEQQQHALDIMKSAGLEAKIGG